MNELHQRWRNTPHTDFARWMSVVLATATFLFTGCRPKVDSMPAELQVPARVGFPPELVSFTQQGNGPVFQAAGPRHWDAKIRERSWIIREDGGYRLWYTGYDGTP